MVLPPSQRRRSDVSTHRAVDAIAQPVPAADHGQEPRIAGIEGAGGEIEVLEGADAIAAADDLARRLVAEIAHHGDAAAVAAERVMHPVDLAHMRQEVEGEGNVAG